MFSWLFVDSLGVVFLDDYVVEFVEADVVVGVVVFFDFNVVEVVFVIVVVVIVFVVVVVLRGMIY